MGPGQGSWVRNGNTPVDLSGSLVLGFLCTEEGWISLAPVSSANRLFRCQFKVAEVPLRGFRPGWKYIWSNAVFLV